MKLDTLKNLYLEQLQDLYDAENQIMRALPRMAEAASSEDLVDLFEEHLEITRHQVERLETIFDRQGAEPRRHACRGMAGILEEGEELLDMDGEPAVIDAGLIAAAQRVEHYEMAGYGCARTYARLLGDDNGAHLLQETLDEEGEADKKLTALAERHINLEAAG